MTHLTNRKNLRRHSYTAKSEMTSRSATQQEANPGDQYRFTRAEYDRLNSFQQGLVSYMQAAWNKDVPEKCYYTRGSKDWTNWHKGQERGVMIAQDGDDE